MSERSKLAREKQLREEVEREKAALEARLIQYQEEVSLYHTFLKGTFSREATEGGGGEGEGRPGGQAHTVPGGSQSLSYSPAVLLSS